MAALKLVENFELPQNHTNSVGELGTKLCHTFIMSLGWSSGSYVVIRLYISFIENAYEHLLMYCNLIKPSCWHFALGSFFVSLHAEGCN